MFESKAIVCTFVPIYFKKITEKEHAAVTQHSNNFSELRKYKFRVVRISSCTVSWLVIPLEVLVLLQNLFLLRRSLDDRLLLPVACNFRLQISSATYATLFENCWSQSKRCAVNISLRVYSLLVLCVRVYLTYSKSTPYVSLRETVVNRVPPASKLKKPERRRRAKKMKTACSPSH